MPFLDLETENSSKIDKFLQDRHPITEKYKSMQTKIRVYMILNIFEYFTSFAFLMGSIVFY